MFVNILLSGLVSWHPSKYDLDMCIEHELDQLLGLKPSIYDRTKAHVDTCISCQKKYKERKKENRDRKR